MQGIGEAALNESPSEKEGKWRILSGPALAPLPSMKVPPKRKGNSAPQLATMTDAYALNESPSEKEGKYTDDSPTRGFKAALNESPSEKEGK